MTTSPRPIIRAAGLSKRFRRATRQPGLRGTLIHLVCPRYETLPSVAGIALEIFAGESVAYVGPNGAGTSTTIKLLTGILVPTDGEVEVCGITPWRHRVENALNMGSSSGSAPSCGGTSRCRSRSGCWAISTSSTPGPSGGHPTSWSRCWTSRRC